MGRYDDDSTEDTGSTATADEAVDEAPDPSTQAKARKVIKRGWGNAEQVKSADSPFAQRLKIGEAPQIIKFLEEDPYTSYHQHWVERQGQKSFTCLRDFHDKGCPLCEAGDRPSARFAFNVALLSDNGDPIIKSYEVGPRIIDQLKNFHMNPSQGPLPKNYWAVSRTGKGPTSQTSHQMVKERDLAEDFNIEPLTEAQLDAVRKTAYDASIVSIPAYKTVKTIATEELGD